MTRFVIEGLELRLAQQGRELANAIKMNPAVDHSLIRNEADKRLDYLTGERDKEIANVRQIIREYDAIAGELEQLSTQGFTISSSALADATVERERFIDSEDKIVISTHSREELYSLSMAWLQAYGGSLCLCDTNSRGFVATRGRIRGEWRLLGVVHAEKPA